MGVKSMTMIRNGRLFRYGGGSFIAVWNKNLSSGEEHPVPDDMIELPGSLNRAQATQEDLKRLIEAYKPREPQYARHSMLAQSLPYAVLSQGYTHVVVQPHGEIHRIQVVEVHVLPDNSKMLKVTFPGGEKSLSLLPELEVVVAKELN